VDFQKRRTLTTSNRRNTIFGIHSNDYKAVKKYAGVGSTDLQVCPLLSPRD
jgi:hypothetical protein